MSVVGIVVGGADFGEAHRVVRLLTAEQGRLSLLARSARRSKKRFAGMLDVGTRLRIATARGRGDLQVIADLDRLGGPRKARGELERIALLAYGCELCASLAAEGEAEPRLFRLLTVWLELLEADALPGAASRVALEAKALTFAGLAPALVRCAECSEPLEGDVMYDASAGGGVHSHCGSGQSVGAAHLARLDRLRHTPLVETTGEPSPRWGKLLGRSIQAHVGRPMRSKALIDELEDGPTIR